MEQKKETRGRPKTEKKYKHVNFRLEEKVFDKFDIIAQEKSGVSLHSYIRDNFPELFNEEYFKMNLPKEIMFFFESLDGKGNKKNTLKEINDTVESFLLELLESKMIDLFADEYRHYRPEGYEENEYSGIRIEDIMDLIHFRIVTGENLTKYKLRIMTAEKIVLFLKKYPPKNELLKSYFLNYY